MLLLAYGLGYPFPTLTPLPYRIFHLGWHGNKQFGTYVTIKHLCPLFDIWRISVAVPGLSRFRGTLG